MSKVCTKFFDFNFIETIRKASYSEDKSKWLLLEVWYFFRIKHLTIEWSKSRSCADKTFTFMSLLEGKMSKREKSLKYTPDFSITDNRASSAIWDSFYNKGKCCFCKRCQRICSIESRGKLKHDILTSFWWFCEHIWTWIYKLKNIVCQWYFLYELKLNLLHEEYFVKIFPIMRRFWFFSRENYAAFFTDSVGKSKGVLWFAAWIAAWLNRVRASITLDALSRLGCLLVAHSIRSRTGPHMAATSHPWFFSRIDRACCCMVVEKIPSFAASVSRIDVVISVWVIIKSMPLL